MRRTLAKFGLPFENATPLVHFPEALKRPRNNAGPAGIGLLIMRGIGLLIRKGIGLLIMKGIGLLIIKGIASRGIDNFSLSQLFGQYRNGKLSIT